MVWWAAHERVSGNRSGHRSGHSGVLYLAVPGCTWLYLREWSPNAWSLSLMSAP